MRSSLKSRRRTDSGRSVRSMVNGSPREALAPFACVTSRTSAAPDTEIAAAAASIPAFSPCILGVACSSGDDGADGNGGALEERMSWGPEGCVWRSCARISAGSMKRVDAAAASSETRVSAQASSDSTTSGAVLPLLADALEVGTWSCWLGRDGADDAKVELSPGRDAPA